MGCVEVLRVELARLQRLQQSVEDHVSQATSLKRPKLIRVGSAYVDERLLRHMSKKAAAAAIARAAQVEQTEAQVASAMGVSEGAMKRHVARAITALGLVGEMDP